MTEMFVASSVGYQDNWWSILDSAFMRHAIIGGTIVALAAGLLGYFIVVRADAFAAHASAHIGLPGATGAVLLGLPPGAGLGVFCVGGAVVIGLLGSRATDRDVATGITLAFATGLGLFFNSLARKNASTMTNVLFGNLLAITSTQLLAFTGLLVLLMCAIAAAYRPLLYSSINATVARAKGIPVQVLSVAFMVLLGIAVTMAVQAVGTLLLFALLVAPAATAITLTPRPARAITIGTVISVASVWCGLAASAMFNFPPSFLIVTITCGIWLTIWIGHGRRVRAEAAESALASPGRHAPPAPVFTGAGGGER